MDVNQYIENIDPPLREIKVAEIKKYLKQAIALDE
jgi:hypothetical protein